jgi:hypothetical protein
MLLGPFTVRDSPFARIRPPWEMILLLLTVFLLTAVQMLMVVRSATFLRMSELFQSFGRHFSAAAADAILATAVVYISPVHRQSSLFAVFRDAVLDVMAIHFAFQSEAGLHRRTF